VQNSEEFAVGLFSLAVTGGLVWFTLAVLTQA
jgi:hypothetical protein